MRLYVTADNTLHEARTRDLARYGLTRIAGRLAEANLHVETAIGPLGERRIVCQASLRTRRGPQVSAEEVQSRLDLAVSRAISRCVSGIESRLPRGPRRFSA